MKSQSPHSSWRIFLLLAMGVLFLSCWPTFAWAADEAAATPARSLSFRDMFSAGGVVGIIIMVLSVVMVALIAEHIFSFRRSALMPPGPAEQTHTMIAQQQFPQAEELCKGSGSFLGRVLASGLAEVSLGYNAVEKSMEDASREQSARMFRKIEYLSVIGTIAPMLGLLGTVWGMILAFMEFETKANPQVSELAPGIYRALVTTLMGLSVAVPALASFAIFRNRIDELVAEASLLAEHVFLDFKRSMISRRKSSAKSSSSAGSSSGGKNPTPGIPPIAIERGPR